MALRASDASADAIAASDNHSRGEKQDAAKQTGSGSGSGAFSASKPSIDVACGKASKAWPTAYAATAAAPPLMTMPNADSATGGAVKLATG